MKRYIKSARYDFIEKDIDNILHNTLDEMHISIDDVHLFSEEEASAFRKALKWNLKDAGIDLSFDSVIIPTGHLKVGGNLEGMSNDLLRGLIRLGWTKVKKSIEDLNDCATDGCGFYIEDRYGYCKKATFEEFMSVVKSGSKTSYRGLGSQASIAETTVTVYEDNDYNIKVGRSTLIYD